MASEENTILTTIKKKLTSFGPAFFIIGYVVGTGSVTSMVVSGADYGLRLSWALLLSCFFTYFLIIAISKLTIVSGNSLLYNFKTHFGKPLTLFIMLAVLVLIISSIVGIMGIVTEVVVKWLSELSDGAIATSEIAVALFFIFILLVLFWRGKHASFLNIMTVLVSLMALSFVVTSVVVLFNPEMAFSALFEKKDSISETNGSIELVIAGLVGTTMAAVVLVSRSILVEEEGWKLSDLKRENKDAGVSMVLTFIISLAIMISAAGTLYVTDFKIENAIDMMNALVPVAGEFAMSLFAIGIIAAALSSIFPNLLLFPWLWSDYNETPRKLDKPMYRIMVVCIALAGMAIPIFGGKPIWILIASQALSPFVMPLITLFLIILLNRKNVMQQYKIGWAMNLALVCTFIFNCYMLTIALSGLSDYMK
ncbi:NRAMP family divalent metal transporter [Ulvibacterium marinum]|uniref:Divalent metal cation transporter n=1 Tax=Ulvibacterium marinum TaxID=2419782 RepID=A0A3B0CHY5_9FLAO|nr:divalent metal cation transporter [Ulvibacterium marinum]RKN83446.1 hypothetical protein D7Z94_06390 [Ulvibacterium marinum]